MVTEADREESVREFRLEGAVLFVVVGALLACLVGAFYFGRWYERQTAPALSAGGTGSPDPLGRVAEQPAAEAERDMNFFDTLSGEEKAAEPARQAAAPPTREPGPAAPAPAPGDFFVQVFAGRDRESAEALVSRLRGQGYRPQLDSASEGQGRLFKVRVGGYASRELAQAAADKLRAEGYPGSWVTRPE